MYSIVITLLLLASLALQLLPIITSPISSLSLLSLETRLYGVFGSCEDTNCTPIALGYPDNVLLPESDFLFGFEARKSLSMALVVHPIAAAFMLVLSCGAAIASFAELNSTLYTFLVIWTVPTLLLALTALLVDIFLFSPYVSWLGWVLIVPIVVCGACGAAFIVIRKKAAMIAQEPKLFEYSNSTASSKDALLMEPSMENFGPSYMGPPDSGLSTASVTETASNSSRLLEVIDVDNSMFPSPPLAGNLKINLSDYKRATKEYNPHMLTLLPELGQITSGQTPYPESHRASWQLPSEKKVLRLARNSVESLRTRRLRAEAERVQPRFGELNDLFRNRGIAGLQYGNSSSEFLEDDKFSDLGTNGMSEVISQGEALEIHIASRQMPIAREIEVSPTLPLTPHRTGFLSSILESLKSADSDLEIEQILTTTTAAIHNDMGSALNRGSKEQRSRRM